MKTKKKKTMKHLTRHINTTDFTNILNEIIISASYYDTKNLTDLYKTLDEIKQRYTKNEQQLAELRSYSEALIKEQELKALERARIQYNYNIQKINRLKIKTKKNRDFIKYFETLIPDASETIGHAIKKNIYNCYEEKYDIECIIQDLKEYNEKFEQSQFKEECAVEHAANIILLENAIADDRKRIEGLEKFITEVENFKNKAKPKFNNKIKGTSNE